MRILLTTFTCLSMLFCFSQNHEENISAIKTIEQANSYAASFREVSVSIVNAEKDVMFFDDIDTSNLEKYVGTSKTFYGRTTKLIEDSMLTLINVQVISFDLTTTSKETAELLVSQMNKRLDNGETFWGLKKKYGHTSAQFNSSPEPLESITGRYNLDANSLEVGKKFNWEILGSKDQIGILIVEKAAHKVPAFYAISYLSMPKVR